MEQQEFPFDPQDVENNKVVSALCYLGILFFLPLVVNKESAFGRFHANQGLLLLIVGVISSFLYIIPILGWIAGGIMGIVCLVLMIMGIVNTLNGKAKELPVIGKFRLLH